MKIKDSTVIALLIFVVILEFMGVMGAEAEISRLENQISVIYSQQNDIYAKTYDIVSAQTEMDARITAAERTNRLQDTRLAMHRQELTDTAAMFSDLLVSMERLETHLKSLPDNSLNVNVSEQDIRDIAALVYLEAGSQSYSCQKAIASVIFNRMIRYNMTAHQTIYQSGVFSPASRVSSTRPSAASMMAVREVLEEGTTLPSNVVAFRNGHYHTFGHPYCSIDGVYFTAM